MVKFEVNMKKIIYVDNAATTKLNPKALEKMLPYLSNQHGNGSSLHGFGRETRKILETSKQNISTLLGGGDDSQIIFTSGGTEANNLAIKGYMSQSEKKHFITSQIEHSSVLETAKYLETQGFSVSYLPVDEQGLVSLDALKQSINPETALVSVMYSNNEIGTIQDIASIADICHNRNVPLHCDGVQAVGHLPMNLSELGISMLSFSAHKFHGPQGVGALYLAKGVSLATQIHGGGQENGLRSGTENLAGVVGMVEALSEGVKNMEQNRKHLRYLQKYLSDSILQIPNCFLLGNDQQKVPEINNFLFQDVQGEGLMALLDIRGIACSVGSACSLSHRSHVLEAVHVPEHLINSSIRISLGVENTIEEMKYISDSIHSIVPKLRTKRN